MNTTNGIRAAALLSLAALLGCSGGSTLPPLVEQEHPEQPGKFVWHNLITPDPEAARAFYSGLFGWELEVLEEGKYTELSYQGRPLGGIVDAGRAEGSPKSAVWLSGLSVPDVDEAMKRAVAAGAKQLAAATDLPDIGRAAVISDSEGAVVQLVRSKRGDPPSSLPAVHTWLWHELTANDPARAAAFYENLVGYQIELREANEAAGYRLLVRDGRPHGGILLNPFEGTRPAWVPFVRVADPAALLPRVVALGGQVVLAPRKDLRGGTVALVLDPSGAPLALQKWNPKQGDQF